MSKLNPQFERYMDHVGHHIVVAFYGDPVSVGYHGAKANAVNVAIECEDCGCVLTDENRYEEDQ